MAAGDFKLYVSKPVFEKELAQLEAKLGRLNGLLQEYQAKKEEARRVWGEEDENLAKAQHLCDVAIQAVQKKIKGTQESKNALQSILESAQAIQADMGSQLDQATAQIQRLLS